MRTIWGVFVCKIPLLARRTRPKAAGRPSAARDDRVSYIQGECAFGGDITNALKMNVSTSSCLLFNFLIFFQILK